jgi:hypothetical protein
VRSNPISKNGPNHHVICIKEHLSSPEMNTIVNEIQKDVQTLVLRAFVRETYFCGS